ncbi:aspartate aminotransferase family protein [Vallitalea sp.]|jgi:acetylornithine/N-succinyldiaminopimelate aminotransferase|uniref:aspartate aminotransferase family protein n=1 Tax=Vallitalea sp. TaxID=1882829 RepID=UPI0025F84A7B|nr:aspartate aminotransferase family protein [Vallitalea sp.]MCT4687179.1 aspartate aminotransferase family protein [Vallitalea sp.]
MEQLINKGKKVFMSTYAQFPIVIEKGEGVKVYDEDGNEYIDFVAGIAVNSLGYKNERLVTELKEQLDKLTHCSNLYWNEPAIEAAGLLVEYSGLDKVFFCNSGAEAIEGSLKLARKYAKKNLGTNKNEIITMKNSFHGRTYGAVTATGQLKYQKGLDPLLPGVKYAEFNNIESLKEVIDDNTCAVLMEPIQGEGGIRPANKEYLKQVREICDKNKLVLIFDEVQCGIGRTGEIFAYELYEVKPDIVALAKGLGGGVPIGAVIANEEVAKGFCPGDHASTFGGNPLVCTAAKVVLEEISDNEILDNVKVQGNYLTMKLNELKDKYDFITDVRGHGLMLGMEMDIPVKDIIIKCMEKGLLLVGSGERIIRFVPPLIVKKEDIDSAILVLGSVLEGEI